MNDLVFELSDTTVITPPAPYIGDNEHWYVYDSSTGEYVDSGIDARGRKGEDGAAATIAVGTVEYGNTLSIVNSGTSSAAVFDFSIPIVHAQDDGAGNVTLY